MSLLLLSVAPVVIPVSTPISTNEQQLVGQVVVLCWCSSLSDNEIGPIPTLQAGAHSGGIVPSHYNIVRT